jgi:hypothetical protein
MFFGCAVGATNGNSGVLDGKQLGQAAACVTY